MVFRKRLGERSKKKMERKGNKFLSGLVLVRNVEEKIMDPSN